MPDTKDNSKSKKDGEEDEKVSTAQELQYALPNESWAKSAFLLEQSDDIVSDAEKKAIRTDLEKQLKEANASGHYKRFCARLKWKIDEKALKRMEEHNAKTLAELEAKVADAEANAGDSEVCDAKHRIANHLLAVGDKDEAVSHYESVRAKTAGGGGKLDIAFTLLRTALFYDDDVLFKRELAKAHQLMQDGGDWDRRNRLKDYEALHVARQRNFERAAELFLDTLPTYNALELMDMDEYVRYTVLMALVSLDRVQLKEKVLHSSEVLSTVGSLPHIEPLMRSLYDCEYRLFFESLAEVVSQMARDRHLARHARFFCREMRIKAYMQKLHSYRTVRMDAMAAEFGVTVDFLDEELSRFIALNRLPCKLDKVDNIISMSREKTNTLQYQSMIRQGDALLNKVQKLARVINM